MRRGRESMRDNYNRCGVDGYYSSHGGKYCNPHYGDLVKVMHHVMNVFLSDFWSPSFLSTDEKTTIQCENMNPDKDGQQHQQQHQENCHQRILSIFDLACGSGEATAAIEIWNNNENHNLRLLLDACDPYTYEAYESRIGRSCKRYSFDDIADGILLNESLNIDTQQQGSISDSAISKDYSNTTTTYDLCVCSFAMHLVPESKLFSVLYQLASACKYLLILSPHKKPVVKPEMMWKLEHIGVKDRIHYRLFSSLLW